MIDQGGYSISERRVSRFSLSETSSSVSPACTKHPRQSPLWCTRTTPQQCGHSSCSCDVAESESVRLVKSIFYCPSFRKLLGALLWLIKAGRFLRQTQVLARARRARSLHVRSSVAPCTSISTETHARSFKKNSFLKRKRSSFYLIVSIMVSN
jgi:hypothetical protein